MQELGNVHASRYVHRRTCRRRTSVVLGGEVHRDSVDGPATSQRSIHHAGAQVIPAELERLEQDLDLIRSWNVLDGCIWRNCHGDERTAAMHSF